MNLPGVDTVYIGPRFKRPYTAIVNSHQNRFPVFQDAWIERTMRCVDMLAKRHAVLLGSIGLNCHEFPLWDAGNKGLSQIVVAPIPRLERAGEFKGMILSDFGLNPERTGFLFFKSAEVSRKSPIRDRLILGYADTVFPVSIREKGRTRKLLSDSKFFEIDRRFEVPFENRNPGIRIPEVRNSQLKDPGWGRLTHWTRSLDGPFPGESRADYYRAVVETQSGYSHSALRSLMRILDEQTVLAGTQAIRGGYRVVSFTELPPDEAVRAMKWNSSRIRYTFEPYGLAIKTGALEKIGARPVIYGNTDDFEKLEETDRPFHQNTGKRQKWTVEKEWRILGDLSLADIPKDGLLVLVPDGKSAAIVDRKFPGYDIQCLGRGTDGNDQG